MHSQDYAFTHADFLAQENILNWVGPLAHLSQHRLLSLVVPLLANFPLKLPGLESGTFPTRST